MEITKLRCPLSFGFAMATRGPSLQLPGVGVSPAAQEVSIGFNCIGDHCALWHPQQRTCRLIVMQEHIEKFYHVTEVL